MTALIIRGDARRLPLPDASVDLICTSPPYFALRSYQDSGEHYDGQIGSESTPAQWVQNMLDCTREWIRVLKPTGSIFVNLGDSYAAKSLLGNPWRYALRCIDDLGLILRAEIIWDKPNGLPESATDRVRRSHEQWFHLVKQLRYYSAIDEVREASGPFKPPGRGWLAHTEGNVLGRATAPHCGLSSAKEGVNPLGKLPGSVWSIPSQPLTVPVELGVDHFAAFPTEWPRRIILGWTPGGICVECGEGRRPTTSRALLPHNRRRDSRIVKRDAAHDPGTDFVGTGWNSPDYPVAHSQFTVTGYACGCPDTLAPTRPAVILDPFGGTGTVALVASALGRIGISVDLSHDYSRLAQWRTTDPAERAKALHVDKPPPVLEGQLDMWEGALT